MKNKIVKIGGYEITQLSETDFEAQNLKQELDFYFEKNDLEFDVFIFDSRIQGKRNRTLISKDNTQDAFLGIFSASDLEEAVTDAMQCTRENVKEMAQWT